MLGSVLLVGVGVLLGACAVLVLWLRERQTQAVAVARLAAEREAAVRERDTAHDLLDAERQAFAGSQAQLRDSFAALARTALQENRQDFVRDASALITPLRETLGLVQTQLVSVDQAREGSFRTLSAHVGSLAAAQEQLRSVTEDLTRSLRSPNVRGKWGEIQLKRIVELAGLLPHCDFIEKPTVRSADGARQTPDLLVRLPGDANIVVDAKVPIDAYLSATSVKDDAERQPLLAQHARQVRAHVQALGAKEYWRQFDPAPEFVIMFLPLEPLLASAFEHDPALFEEAASLRVIPASPMTLLAVLKAVAFGWQQQAVARNTEEIQALGRELYERLAKFVEHIETVGQNIKAAAQSYDRLVGSLEQKVLPGARRFRDLGVSSSRTLDIVDPLHLEVRRVVKPELTGIAPEADDAEPATLTPLLETQEP
jgi:DNA recombination protein RmuC